MFTSTVSFDTKYWKAKSDQNKFRKAKYGQVFIKESAKSEYEELKNKTTREFVPQHKNLVNYSHFLRR